MFSAASLTLLLPANAQQLDQQPPSFDLLEIQVDGNSVLDSEAIEKTVYPFLGNGKTIEAVEQARLALEKLYREKGYQTVMVEIPEQDVVEGLVKLNVVEGSVERLKVSGSRYYALGRIVEQIPELAAGKVPHMPTVQQQLSELSKQSVDRQITPIFRAGSTPGKAEVELKVKDELPLHGSLEVNANNSASTSRLRTIAALRYDNLWQRFHSASLQFQISPENDQEVEVWSGTYVMPTGWEETRLALYGIGVSSNTQLGASVGGMSVIGTGSIYGGRLIKPLPGLDDYDQNFQLGFDYKNFDQGISNQGQDRGNSPISYSKFQLGYDATWRGSGFKTLINSALNFAVRGMGSDESEFASRRANARPNFFYFTSELKHLQQMPWDMRMVARAGGQISHAPLISNEQFAAGGMQSVRGYHQTEQLGDDGVNLSVEWQSPKLVPDSWEFSQELRAHSFIDYAYLNIQSPLPGNPDHYVLAGAGVGLRWQFFKHLVGEFDWAFPLYRQGSIDVGDQRVDFRLAYEY